MSGRSESVAALIVAGAALLVTCVFGFLTFVPGVDPGVGGFFELAFFGGAAVTLAAFVAYFVLSRRTSKGAPKTAFDRLLEHRAAALGAVPAGLVAIAIGVLWFAARRMGPAGASIDAPGPAPIDATGSIDAAAVGAFLGFGTLFVVLCVWIAIRAERKAIGLAREDAEVTAA